MADNAYPVSSLAALIQRVVAQEAIEGNVLNYSDIERRSGGEVSRGNVRNYAIKKQQRVLEPEKRHGLALGLGVHPSLVDRAMAEDVGLVLNAEFEYDYRTDPDISAADRRKIDAYIDGIRGKGDGTGRRRRSG